MKTALIVDVETTGLSTTDEVIEFAALLFEYDDHISMVGYILETYAGFREPGVPISRSAQRVNGITKNMVAGQRLDDQLIQDLFERADLVIAHNVKFDRRFIAHLYPLSDNKRWRCSMDDIDWESKGHVSKGLQQLADDFSIKAQAEHRALSDCQTVYQLLSIEKHFKELLIGLEGRTVEISSSGEDLYPLQIDGESYYHRNLVKIVGDYDEEEGYEDASHEAFIFVQEKPRDLEHQAIVKIDDLMVGYLKPASAKKYIKRLAALGAPANTIGHCSARISGGKLKGSFKTNFGVRLDISLNDFEISPYPGLSPKKEPLQTKAVVEPVTKPRTATATPIAQKPNRPKYSNTTILLLLSLACVLGTCCGIFAYFSQ